eukprot:TRINITY_DN1384_c0_g1_i1.p1 TRINITY_DN1384_c0_g1~~TRINITY_DN1384_c0_g1_i1.p1  ORF type:complete len:531 (-),score=121.33 TRINITY_DN1384_c0_g1_i1:68-1660(-)
MVVFKSLYPEIVIPRVSLFQFISQNWEDCREKTALIDADTGRSYTYKDMEAYIPRIAKGLYNRGIRKGDIVCIVSPNIPEYVFAFYAIVYLGAIVLPINPLYTEDEIHKFVKPMNPKKFVTVGVFFDKVKAVAKRLGEDREIFVFGETSEATPFMELITNPGETDVPPIYIDCFHDVATIVFSSGTGGMPKGVMLTHHNIVANIYQTTSSSAGPYSGAEVFTAFLPFFHIYGLTVLMGCAVFAGKTLVVITKFDFVKYLGYIEKYKITIANVVPPVVLAFGKHPLVEKHNLTSLHTMTSGAAPLDGELQALVSKRFGFIVNQGFGMSEASPVTHYPTPRTPFGSVGILYPNMMAKIVCPETGKELGKNEIGELWLKGPNIMKGYFQNPKATAECIDSEGYYHTGDVAYVDSNDQYYIVDRIKELIKYNGFQVAPAELEGILLTHPEIMDVAVIGKQDLECGELPLAFVVKKKDSPLTEKDIQDYVAAKVSPHKRLRGGVRFVDTIPKSESGKILRRILRDKLKLETSAKL